LASMYGSSASKGYGSGGKLCVIGNLLSNRLVTGMFL